MGFRLICQSLPGGTLRGEWDPANLEREIRQPGTALRQVDSWISLHRSQVRTESEIWIPLAIFVRLAPRESKGRFYCASRNNRHSLYCVSNPILHQIDKATVKRLEIFLRNWIARTIGNLGLKIGPKISQFSKTNHYLKETINDIEEARMS